ncbi:MAG: hypothetical protein JSW43_01390 [Gemmatimonadota bacterium]|nr:MAG: hypothetical protein JSW43_01390 [Gemmatimonadota bacterium]
MVHVDLTADELRILLDVLESYLSDLRMEIADTDRMDFREKLKERKAVLLKVQEALRQQTGANPQG